MSFLQNIPTNEKSSVQVAVRIRPLAEREAKTNIITAVRTNDILITNPDDKKIKTFTFDYVYDINTEQQKVYDDIGTQVINNAYNGYNSCIFAYGQTGCFAIDTPIMLYNGEYKAVQDISMEDIIMGDDLKPRKVMQLFRGIQPMYKVIPITESEPSFTVNIDHTLVFKQVGKNTIVEIPVYEYLTMDRIERGKYTCYTVETKTHSKSEFHIDLLYMGIGQYYGFMLDGNRRFIGAGHHVLRNSGKSHTMMGDISDSIENKQYGIIPRICANLFNAQVTHNDVDQGACDITYRVEMSYLEIYSEEVKDLLRKNHNELRIRQHPEYGPYVEGLSQFVVDDVKTIKRLIEQGNKERTTAATLMNNRSSRSHAILTLYFTQIIQEPDIPKPREIVSKINLVDLAGSEKVEASGVTGINFKEAININKSLSTLGLVITKLATKSHKKATVKKKSKDSLLPVKKGAVKIKVKKKKAAAVYKSGEDLDIVEDFKNDIKSKNTYDTHDDHIPFRDSALTWLLKESLGGNSKTYMIATISPSALNYNETLSTLRYADNAKQIVNNVKINEDPNDKIIRILKSEIEALQRKLKSSIPGTADNCAIADELKQREQLMAEKEKTWEQRLLESQQANLMLQTQLKHELELKQVEFQKQLDMMNNEKQRLIEDMENAKKSISTRAIEEQRKIEEHYEKKQQAYEQVRIVETATSLQEYYEKKLEALRQQYEEKLQARDAKEAQTTVYEIEKLKQNNQLLKDTLTQNQINLQTQIRQFTLERGLLSKQIQQLHAKIHLLDHDLTEDQHKMTKEYEFIKQKRDDEERRFQTLQVEYKALAEKIEHDGKLLDELNAKHNIVLREIESSNKNLVMIKREYADLQARFEADKDEYNILLIKKEELHTEILHLKTELDMHVMQAKEQLKNPTTDDLIKIRDGFDQIFNNLKSIKK